MAMALSLSPSFSIAGAIGILITRSAKIARSLERVITPGDVALLSYLIFSGEQQAGRWPRRTAVFLPRVLSDKERRDPRAEKHAGNPETGGDWTALRGWRLDGHNVGDQRAGVEKVEGKEERNAIILPGLFNFRGALYRA
jgi:hypothetical protein